MYLRKTSRKNKDGSVVQYYQLAHNERHPVSKKSVAKIIHNFGRADELDPDSLARLCRSIGRVCGLTIIDESDSKLMPPGVCGLPDGLKIRKTYEYGCSLVIEILWERVGLKKIFSGIIRKNRLKAPYERALLAMVANRLCEPESKLGVWDRWLAKACGKYLLATRMSSVSEIKRDVLTKRGRYKVIKDNLHAKEVIVGDGERRRRYVLCYNPKEAKRQCRHREYLVDLLEQEIKRHPKKDASAKWAIGLLASKRFKRYLSVSKSNRIRIDRAKIREAARYDGKWVLETNDDTISMEDAASGYNGLMVIERCFRSLKKTQIKMTPMYHWAQRRIETHVRICVLALLIERMAELKCNKPWHHIRKDLSCLQVTEFFKLKYRFFCRNEVAPSTHNILNLLKISIPKQILHVEND